TRRSAAGCEVRPGPPPPMSSGSAGFEAQPSTTAAAIAASVNPTPKAVKRSGDLISILLGQRANVPYELPADHEKLGRYRTEDAFGQAEKSRNDDFLVRRGCGATSPAERRRLSCGGHAAPR